MLTFATSPIVKLVLTSLAGGLSVAVVFSIAVLGVTRSNDLRRERRSGAAAAYGLIGIVGLALAAAIVVFGVVLVAHKS
jgi:hypothetical protein